MTVTIAYLGPEGTYTQLAALAYSLNLEQHDSSLPVNLLAFPSIPKAMQATAEGMTTLTIVPVENSTEGGVTTTLDTLWQLQQLKIHHAVVMPIRHGLLSQATCLSAIEAVFSHPQALSQCQRWLEHNLPQANLVATRSTTEALDHLTDNSTVAAISSEWAAQLYNLPILVHNINDHSDNCTKFWVLKDDKREENPVKGRYTSLAFSLPVNSPGALLKPLDVFARSGINLSRIESRPTKRSLGEYLFFVDLETDAHSQTGQQALNELLDCTESLVNFGTYDVVTADPSLAAAKARTQSTQALP
ncbi:prephenate dehydratase [Phormidium tenue]|uniref:Prephenate dehydratase n=1 Tax=Phormidium tenue NIES-30 TaxID=549789 RepID=A0A1U7JBI4_9CYAN|nr:prephenate dehydratase [Phormidium tenue]MBD2230038.1 prephenate dehydratase [Phormidium tenue FACHB-1052]OKH51121.1 prephenate dehydratase [Phormidium tenue NIES-30]